LSDLLVWDPFLSSPFFSLSYGVSHFRISCRIPERLFRALIENLWKFLDYFFPHRAEAFFIIDTDEAPLRGC
jgi:hypothetical protein